jgi:hypothetical protein
MTSFAPRNDFGKLLAQTIRHMQFKFDPLSIESTKKVIKGKN